jgi:hypothetical protein
MCGDDGSEYRTSTGGSQRSGGIDDANGPSAEANRG